MGGPEQAERPATAAVGGVVVDRRGRVLVIRRGRPPMAGAWTLPGGRVEAGEAMERAIVREVLEETAIVARVIGSLGVVPLSGEGFSYAIHEYLLVPAGDAVPAAGDDAAEARWVSPGDLASLDVGEAAVDVIRGGLHEARARGLVDTDFPT